MEFEFDPAESAANKAWREVDFEEAQDKDRISPLRAALAGLEPRLAANR
jgi:hypothetical protein